MYPRDSDFIRIKYVLEKSDGINTIKIRNKDKPKKHRNVLYSEPKTAAASPLGKIHPLISIFDSNSILISAILFIGHPAPTPQTLLATPLVFNRARGSSLAHKPPLARLQRLTFISADVSNGPMLMHRGRTPSQRCWTPGLSANDRSITVCTG